MFIMIKVFKYTDPVLHNNDITTQYAYDKNIFGMLHFWLHFG